MLFWPQSFPRGLEALCASICAQWIKAGWGVGGDKAESPYFVVYCSATRRKHSGFIYGGGDDAAKNQHGQILLSTP